MDKHTFKVGDIVTYHFKYLAPPGTQGVVTERREAAHGVQIWSKALDRRYKDVDGFSNECTIGDWIKHDTDLRKGDWVRYEGVAKNYIGSLEGHVGTIIGGVHSDSARVQFPGITDVFLTANLVKIQPPQEEKKMDRNSIKIRNKITGKTVSGVAEVDNPCVGWEFMYEDGSCRVTYYRTHWEPVEEWVKIEVRENEWATVVKSLGIITVNKKAHDGTTYLSTIGWRPVK